MTNNDGSDSSSTWDTVERMLSLDRYPRSSAYPARWVIENLMGPHPLWLAERLAQVMSLVPGMRVLDLGCGKALSSIFLAKEFGVEVWAVDKQVPASDNWQRIVQAGLGDRVFPLACEAHSLPFAEDFFDALISVGAYHYFGTDDLYLGYCLKFVKPGGRVGVVSPGTRTEAAECPPPGLAEFWDWRMCTFHSPEWWSRHWEKTGQVTVEVAEPVPHGHEDWALWLEACDLVGEGCEEDAGLLRADTDHLLGFTRLVARRREKD
jgi:SAM-dependent methyltransferase